MPPDNRRGSVRLLVQWFDVLFIMLLCSLTLLTTILLQPAPNNGPPDYSFNPWAFGGVAALLAIYLGYVLWHSDRELREIIDHVYGPPEVSPDSPEVTPDSPESSELSP